MSFLTDDRRTGIPVHITLDGKPVVADSSQTIFEVCLERDIHIPTLCWHPKTKPIAACRLCLVKVEGDDRMTASCDIKVQEGMSILTNTPEVLEHRKKAMNFVLLHHPLDCPECDKSGECDLQDRTVELGVLEQPYSSLDPNKQIDLLSPMVELVHTRCIVCGRCVEVCQQLQGARAIDYVRHDGFLTKVGQTLDDGFECESCGQCISVCPVGVILDIPFKYSARPWELKKQKSICTHCSLGCTVVTEYRAEEVYRNTVDDYAGINEGNLCSLGRFGWDTIKSPTRLEAPALRRGGQLHPVGPTEAIGFVADELNRIKREHGGGSIAGLVGSRMSNEEMYLFAKLLRRNLETNHIDVVTTLANRSLRRAARAVLGAEASPANLEDVKQSDVILILNSGLVNSHPMAVLELLDCWKRDKAQTIVTGYQVNKLSRDCGTFTNNRPGTDGILLYGILHILFDQKLIHENEAAKRIANLEQVKAAVAQWTPERVEAATGTPAKRLRRIAARVGLARNLTVVIGNTAVHEYTDDARAMAALTLSLVTGNIGRPGAGPVLLFEGGNVQGAFDVGAVPDRLPGHRPLDNPAARDDIAGVWAHGVPGAPGRDTFGILQAIKDRKIKALYVLGADVAALMDEVGEDLSLLDNLELLVVHGTHDTPLTEYAHAVLPAAEGPEREATFTAVYRVLQRQRRAVAPRGLAQPAVEVLEALGEATGRDIGPVDVTSVLKELKQVAPIYADVEIGALAVEPYTWPYDVVAAQKPVRVELPAAPPVPETNGQLLLTVPIDLHTTDPRSLEAHSLDAVRPAGKVHVHPDEAKARGWGEGTPVTVSRNGHAVERRVHVTRQAAPGALAIPLHERAAWGPLLGPQQPGATAPALPLVTVAVTAVEAPAEEA